MGSFFLGVLRSGTRDAFRAALSGLDVEVSFVPGELPGADAPPVPYVPPAGQANWSSAPGYLQLIIREIWPQAAWEHAAAIAGGESSFDPTAWNQSGEDSRGLWQINVGPGANSDLLALGDLFDPRTNAQAAFIVWSRQGWRAWQNVATSLGIPLSGPGIP